MRAETQQRDPALIMDERRESMQINIRDDHIEIEGYVNAVERNSKPLISRIGEFIERVCKGAFKKALERNADVKLLLNHDPERELGSQKQGNLELNEDAIGLHARATITDPEVMQKGIDGDLVGWSFGFYDVPEAVERSVDAETNLPLRKLRDMDLVEVSILDRSKTPAYDGTLVTVRSDGTGIYYAEAMMAEPKVIEQRSEPETEMSEQPKEADDIQPVDYSKYLQLIQDLKED